MPKTPKDYGYDKPFDEVKHEGNRPLDEGSFVARVSWLKRRLRDALQFQEDGFPLNPDWLWNTVLAPLAQDVLPPKELAKLVGKYTQGRAFTELTRDEQKRLVQSVVSLLAPRLKKGSGSGQSQGSQKGQSAQAGQAGHSGPSSVHPGGQPTPYQGQQSGPPPTSEKSKPSNIPTPQPKKWDDLSEAEQEALREAIENNDVEFTDTPQDGATQLDMSSLPQDLQQKARENLQNRGKDGQPQASKTGESGHAPSPVPTPSRPPETTDSSADESPNSETSPERPTHPETPHPAPKPKKDLDQLLKEAAQREKRNAGRQVSQQASGGDEVDAYLDYVDQTTSDGDNKATGFKSVEEMLKNVGYGGGGATMDLRVHPKTPEERLFRVVQEQFLRLGGEPDTSDRLTEGSEVWSSRRLIRSKYNPTLIPTAKDDFARSPEDIYFILDTSGSVSEYANVIAAMAAGALGLVHLFHGPEAHPTYQILRNSPLTHPRQFKGLGEEYGYAATKDGSVPAEKQRDICQETVPGYKAFLGRQPQQGFDANLAWFLRYIRPARGSRLIFWGDTMSVHFQNPQMLYRMLRPYKFVWMLPFPLTTYQTMGMEDTTFEQLLERPTRYNRCEYRKLQAVNLQVIGDANSPEGLRRALRKVR